MMKKKRILQAVLVLVAAGFLTTTFAGDDTFSRLDTNADGAISSEEATASKALYRGWESADANQDGQVDASEFSAFESSASAEGH